MAMNTLPTEGKIRNKTHDFSSFDGRDMLIFLKDIALEPCNMMSSHPRLQNQLLKVRKLLNASAKRPQRKRKFDRYEDSKLADTYGLINRDKHGNKNAKNRRRDESSFLSSSLLSQEKWGHSLIQENVAFPAQNDRAEHCSLNRQDLSVGAEQSCPFQGTEENVATPALNDGVPYCSLGRQDYSLVSDRAERWDSLQGTEGHVALLAPNDGSEYCSICRKDYSHQIDRAEPTGSLEGALGNVALSAVDERSQYSCVCRQGYSDLSDSDESIKGPNTMKQGNLERHHEDVVTGSGCTHSTEISSKEGLNIEFLDESKSLANGDFDILSEASHSLSSEIEDMELGQPKEKFLPSRLTHFRRLPIPLGPRFQAEVPVWEGTINVRHYNCDDLKWLGTQVWPMPEVTETNNTNGIGKGRSDSCCCDIPGSVDCVRQHISEARKLLQSDILTAFSSWKFDDMGEDVSKSWTLKEQKDFESLVRLNPLSGDTDFWKLAMEHFPTKSMESMVNYYYNVHIPRRMSMETRSSFGALDSDNDQNEDCKNEDSCSTRQMGVPIFKLLKSKKQSIR